MINEDITQNVKYCIFVIEKANVIPDQGTKKSSLKTIVNKPKGILVYENSKRRKWEPVYSG